MSNIVFGKDAEVVNVRNGNKIMTLSQAGAILGLSPVTLRIQAEKGVLRAEKLGRDWIVTNGEVQRYATDHKRDSMERAIVSATLETR
jgi:hypothetical protein